MELIDTHAHLYASEFNHDRDSIINEAIKSGITKMVLPAIDSEWHEPMIELAERYPGHLFPMMGLHPTSVNKDYKNELSVAERYISQGSLFFGIGEIGIDLYWDKTYVDEQVDAFITQINWAKQLNRPVVIHTRDSMDFTLNLLEPLVDGHLRGIFHCFGGTPEQAQRVMDMGFLLGIGGVVTFKNGKLGPVLQHTGLNHIVLETDCPYLAPVPYRGKRNESKYLHLIAGKMAEILNISREEVANVTTRNAIELFFKK
jgi:TatD DNase family protein